VATNYGTSLKVSMISALKFLLVCLSSQLNLPGIVADEECTSKHLLGTVAESNSLS
ncbi:transformation/transcription domain-associated protein-like, partial [Trifolium medium]|nr:transformation/transcription domain-associated protein-like [Trifolium medium]